MNIIERMRVGNYCLAVVQYDTNCDVKVFYHNQLIGNRYVDTPKQGLEYVKKNIYKIVFNHIDGLKKRVK